MGQPVVHFEVLAKDAPKLQRYYADLFGWEIDSNNPVNYGIVSRGANVNAAGVGIGGGIGAGPAGYPGTRPSTSRCPTSRRRSRRPRASAGRG